jgi:hypothetical protein
MKRHHIWLIAAVLLALCLLAGNYVVLDEAYGGGPPYYGRTANMDKWVSPFPRLAVVDAVGAALIGLLAWLGRRRRAR